MDLREPTVPWQGDSWGADSSIVRTARKRWTCAGNGANPAEHAPDCPISIGPGDRYVEYVGEAAAYESGSRHTIACGEFFGYVSREAGR